eukprot:6580506-Prymnesium_polylepis.1
MHGEFVCVIPARSALEITVDRMIVVYASICVQKRQVWTAMYTYGCTFPFTREPRCLFGMTIPFPVTSHAGARTGVKTGAGVSCSRLGPPSCTTDSTPCPGRHHVPSAAKSRHLG